VMQFVAQCVAVCIAVCRKVCCSVLQCVLQKNQIPIKATTCDGFCAGIRVCVAVCVAVCRTVCCNVLQCVLRSFPLFADAIRERARECAYARLEAGARVLQHVAVCCCVFSVL